MILLCIAFTGNTTTRILSEEVIPTENVNKIYQDKESGKFFMTFYVGVELKVASIAKAEVKKYYMYKELGVSFKVVLQRLKTKTRIVIRC